MKIQIIHSIALFWIAAIMIPSPASAADAPPKFLRRRLADTFCWKDTEGRGVGTIPDGRGGDKETIGALCYDPCPAGYSRFGFDCHQNCPDGFIDDGLFCRVAEYGRGGGYISNGDCEHHHGSGNCEKWALLWYPKCKSGFKNEACCLCVPDLNCGALGLNGHVADSCAKKIIIGNPVIKTGCPQGKEYNAGLCYTPCQSGYHGVGPVCWSNTPSGWSECGAGDAKTSLDCASAIAGQITSVVQSAVKIATLVIPGAEEVDAADTGATDAASAAEDTGEDGAGDIKTFKKLLAAFKLLMTDEPKVKAAVDAGKDPNVTPESLLKAAGLTNPADIIRFSAGLANLFDPTGLSGVIAAYSYPLCSAIST